MKPASKHRRFIIGLFTISFGIVLAVAVIANYLIGFALQTMQYNIEQRLVMVADQLAGLVSAEELDQYREVEDMELPSYKDLRIKLLEFSKKVDVLYVYYMRPKGNILYYIVDNDFDEETRVGLDSPPDYDADQIPWIRTVLDGTAICSGLGNYVPAWEGLLSAYAPIFGPDGQVVAVAGVDIEDKAIVRARYMLDILAVVEISMVIVVFITGIIALIHFRNAANAAERANASKDDFLAKISHEIRTPMNAITGMAELVLRSKFLAEAHVYAREIKQAGNNIISIINDILDFAKIEAGRMDIVKTNYLLGSLINDVASIIRNRLEEKPVNFHINIAESLPSGLIGDEVRLRQIFLNLLSNAVKYTEKGRIDFSVTSAKQEDDTIWLKVVVTDTGYGIKPEDQKKLFREFTQINTKKNRAIEGTGLGLAITKRLCAAMSGSISVESEYGKGSAFTVIIPQGIHAPQPIGLLKDDVSNHHESATEIKYIFPGAKILVVDDNATNIKVAEGLLAPYKAVVDTCQSGAKAIELARQNEYDLVFMDHMMPEMDGMEATQTIRALGGRFAELPIVAFTANVVSGMKEKFLAGGFNDFLAKPIETDKLDAILRRWIPAAKQQDAPRRIAPEGAAALAPALPKIENVDTVAGIIRMGGSSSLYLDLLRTFLQDAKADFALLEKIPEEGELPAFTTFVHALKSALANIGAYALSGKATVLEGAGHNKDLAIIQENLAPFREELATLLANIGEVTLAAQSAAAGTKSVSHGQLRETLAELGAALDVRDTKRMDAALAKLQDFPLSPEMCVTIGEIARHILFGEFKKAANAVNTLADMP